MLITFSGGDEKVAKNRVDITLEKSVRRSRQAKINKCKLCKNGREKWHNKNNKKNSTKKRATRHTHKTGKCTGMFFLSIDKGRLGQEKNVECCVTQQNILQGRISAEHGPKCIKRLSR